MADEWIDVASGPSVGGDSEWVDVAIGPKAGGSRWLEGAKQLGAGMVETGASMFGALADFNPITQMANLGRARLEQLGILDREILNQPEYNVFQNTQDVLETVEPMLPAPTQDTRYERRIGQFVPGMAFGPGGALLRGAQAVGGGIASQGAEDFTGNKTIAPLVGGIAGSAAPVVARSILKGAFGRGGLFRSGNPQQIEGSAAHLFQKDLGITPKQLQAAIDAAPADDLGALMTTAEITGDARIAQLEKNLAQTGAAAEKYKQLGNLREGMRDYTLGKTTETKAIKPELLRSQLIDDAVAAKTAKEALARESWDLVNRKAEIPVKRLQNEITDTLNLREYKSMGPKTRELVDAVTDPDLGSTRSAGYLQDVRSEALKTLRNLQVEGKASSFDEVILGRLESSINKALDDGLTGTDFDLLKSARSRTADVKQTYDKGKRGAPTGFHLTSEKATPETALERAFLGDRRSVQQTRAALAKPELTESGAAASAIPDMEDLKRGIIDSMPRDGKGQLTPAATSKWVDANETGLRELFGDEHFRAFKRVVSDLRSEASVSDNAFRASRGNSITSQRETVAGVLDELIANSITPGSGPLGQIVDAIKRSAGDKNTAQVRELLFKAALEPEYALKLSKAPTTTRVFDALEGFLNLVKGASAAGTKAGALEILRPDVNSGQSGARGGTQRQQAEGSLTRPNLTPNAPSGAPLTPGIEPPPSQTSSNGASIFSKDQPLSEPSVFAKVLDAVKLVESDGDPNAIGPETKYGRAKGAYQFLDSTGKEYHKKLGIKEPYDPHNEPQQRKLAAAYITDLLKMFDGDMELALTAFHTGPENVKKGKIGPIGRNYARSVFEKV